MTLHFVGGATSEVEVTKDGKKYLYIKAKRNGRPYRVVKQTGEVQIAPYWNKESKMYITER